MTFAAANRRTSARSRKTGKQSLLLHHIPWEDYLKLVEVFGEHHVRMTYDQGDLEIMTPSYEHEFENRFLGYMVLALTDELKLPLRSGGSTTFRKEVSAKGLEPDSCWWIANAPRLFGKKKLDLDVDPPPDLAFEIDVTNNSIPRLPIYAALKVPEIWRFDGSNFTFLVLKRGSKYSESATSRVFPRLTPADVQRFVEMIVDKDENDLLRQFRKWVREHLIGKETR
jgi:Uma2 family endonuclease